MIDKKKYYLARSGSKVQIEDWLAWAKKENKKLKGILKIKEDKEWNIYSPY
jgi:hypothetical protein